MSEAWTRKPVGPRITELPKSVLPAGRADEQGAFPFFCSSPEVKRIDRAISSSPSILMGTGGVATVHLALGPHAYSTDTWAFTVSGSETDLHFLYRQLEHRLPQIDYAGFEGSGLRHLQKDYIRHLRLLCPHKTEQKCIAKILNTLDTAIHQTEAIIAKLKAVKQGLLHDLLTRGIDANGELRPPQAEAPHLYKESPLGWIPREWEATHLGFVTTWASGGTPSRAIASNWIGDVPLLTPKDMKSFELNDTSEHISFGAAQSGSRLMPSETVFIVVRGMILAHSFPVVQGTVAMAFNQDIKAVSSGPTMNSQFLAHWFVANSDRFLRKVTEATHGTKKLDMENLLGMPIGVPPIAEQDGIVARQKAIDDRLENEALSLSKFQTSKSALMDDLLTGRVRVMPLLKGTTP